MKLNSNNLESTIDLKELIKTYSKHWKWFVLSIIIVLTIAFIYLRYATPLYAAQAQIQIIEDKGTSSELSIFKDLDVLSGSSNKVEDEIEILKSRSNFIEVVKKLGLNIKTVSLGNITNTDMYDKPKPFKINFLESDSIIYNSKFKFYINLSTDTTFGYTEEEDDPIKDYSYGKKIMTPVGGIIITPNSQYFKEYKGYRFMVSMSPVGQLAQSYQKSIEIAQIEKESSIVNISLNSSVQKRSVDFINEIINVYNNNGIKDKKAIADKTSSFINDRINEISSSLSSVDQNAVDFMTNKGLSDIGSQTNLNINEGAVNRQELENARVQLNIASAMKDEVANQSTSYNELPSNIGLSDVTISNTTNKYNELVLERKRLLESSNEKNPIIVSLDQQLSSIKRSMLSSLNSMTDNLNLRVNSLSNQQSRINSNLYSAPKNQQALRDITRKQQTTESLYLYLLQKREESQITYASADPKSRIIEHAYASSPFPIAPKKKLVYLASLILGFLIPFSFIYVNDLLDNKINNKTGLEKLVLGATVLGELPKLKRKEDKLIRKDDRSILAESLRILRTNLDYILKSKHSDDKNNIIYVTSSVSGEGKTFLSSNLSMIFANTKKKVLLIGADIRNPKLYTFFNDKDSDQVGKPKRSENVGLTEYLSDDSISSDDIINPTIVDTNTIDVIYSGKLAPNPAELLMSSRVKELLDEVSDKYDYVVVDTAPLMVVTDTLLLTDYADHIIYLTRAGVTEEKVLDYPLKLKEEGKLPNLSFVVNDVKESNLGYGGKYGYGYGKSVKEWWRFS